MICEANSIEHRLTKPNHPWTNGQVARMNRTIKDATAKSFHFDSHDELRTRLADFIATYNFVPRLKTLNAPSRTHHRQNPSFRARANHPRPNPPHVGTEHLSTVPSFSWRPERRPLSGEHAPDLGAELKAELQALGAEFQSDTDTEVVAHLLDRHLSGGLGPLEAFQATLKRLSEASALCVLITREEDVILAARNGPPLAVVHGPISSSHAGTAV